MCGISGFNWEDKNLVREMGNIIRYRGPDDEDVYTDNFISLGHRRLAIIDLSKKGKQPMSNEDGSIWITYNGEIYNFPELREQLEKKGHKFKSDTDTEVIIHSYEEFGEDCLNYFNGQFAFCIYDSNKKKLFLARDRIGIKPLYYYTENKKFIFASEIKSILENREIKRDINLEVLNKFISLRYIPGEPTIFKNIYRLLSGHYLLFDLKEKKIEIKKYWDIDLDKNSVLNKNEDYFKKEIFNLLKGSVKKRLISDVPLGVYLSGGIDSSAIVSLMAQIKNEGQSKEEIKTFSIGFEYGENVNELPYAKQISELFGTDHKEFFIKPEVVKFLPEIIWHLDEPMADPALIPIYLLSENARKYVSVVLTGDGGDEVFAGYDQHKFLSLGSKLKYIPLSHKISTIMKYSPNFLLDKIYKHSSSMGKDSFEKVGDMVLSFKKDNKAKAYYEFISIFNDKERSEILGNNFREINYNKINKEYFNNKNNFLNQLLHFDLKNLLPESFLMKTDRMCMGHSLEGRVPFLDHKLVEFSYRIPVRLKLNGLTTKYILKKTLETMLPKEILYRKKQTFHVPIENWIEKDLKDTFEVLLNEKEIKRLGFFDSYYIKKLFDNYNKGKLFYARKIWSLACFMIWYKKFIEV